MNLDMGELRNRLRSRSNPKEPEPDPDPDPEPDPDPDTQQVLSTPKPSQAPTLPNFAAMLPPNMMGELQSQMEKRRSRTFQEETSPEVEGSPSQTGSRQISSANPKTNLFLGELNSKLKTRRAPEGPPPRIPPKPKLPTPPTGGTSSQPPPFPKPRTSPKPTPSPINFPSCDILSNKPVNPNTSPKADSIPEDVDSPPHTIVSSTSDSQTPNEIPSTEKKGSFFDELKKKISSSLPIKNVERKKIEEDAVDKGLSSSEEKENQVPTLSHEVAKHKLLVRPKKTHKLSYADFRKSRLIQETQPVENDEDADDVLRTIPETTATADVPNPIAAPGGDIVEGVSLEKQDSVDGGGSDLGSPGYSSADNSEEQIFRTPPESPSFASEIGQNESTTSDFYSVSSEPLSPTEGDFSGADEIVRDRSSLTSASGLIFDLEPEETSEIIPPTSEDWVFTSDKQGTKKSGSNLSPVSDFHVESLRSRPQSTYETEMLFSDRKTSDSETESSVLKAKSAVFDVEFSVSESKSSAEEAKSSVVENTLSASDIIPALNKDFRETISEKQLYSESDVQANASPTSALETDVVALENTWKMDANTVSTAETCETKTGTTTSTSETRISVSASTSSVSEKGISASKTTSSITESGITASESTSTSERSVSVTTSSSSEKGITASESTSTSERSVSVYETTSSSSEKGISASETTSTLETLIPAPERSTTTLSENIISASETTTSISERAPTTSATVTLPSRIPVFSDGDVNAVPPVAPCRKARAAKLKLKHEIELFEKKQLEAINTLLEPNKGDSEPMPDHSDLKKESIAKEVTENDASGEIKHEKNVVSLAAKSNDDVACSKKSEETNKTADMITSDCAIPSNTCSNQESSSSAELNRKTSRIEVESGLITEDVEDFVVVEVTKDLQNHCHS